MSEKVSSIHKMTNGGLILAIILILVFLFFLWLVFRCDDDNSLIGLDSCGNPIAQQQVVIIPTEKPIIDDCDKALLSVTKACLDKFAQAEHEIDTLSRSYVIEHLCSCQDAENTYERIQHLCDKLGDYLTVCYNRDVGKRYAQLKKGCCKYLKSCLSQSEDYIDSWIRYETEIADLLASCNSCLSKEFIENIRKEHCHQFVKMYQAHSNNNHAAAMVIYDSLIEKTDTYVENVVTATLNCKCH